MLILTPGILTHPWLPFQVLLSITGALIFPYQRACLLIDTQAEASIIAAAVMPGRAHGRTTKGYSIPLVIGTNINFKNGIGLVDD